MIMLHFPSVVVTLIQGKDHCYCAAVIIRAIVRAENTFINLYILLLPGGDAVFDRHPVQSNFA